MFQLHTVLEFPEFVKEAVQSSPQTVQELDSDRFAWPGQRMFPIHTKADTWLSSAYFHKFGADIPEHTRKGISDMLEKVAEYWGIELPTSDDMKPIQKEASLSHTIKYPLQENVSVQLISGEELQKVAFDILDGGKYPMAVRQSVAKQTLNAPGEFLRTLSDRTISDLQKVAGYGIGTEAAALTAIRQRWHATAHHWKPIKEGLEELSCMVKMAATDGVMSHEMTQKTASMLDAVDRFVGLHHRYSDSFQPPEKQLFNVTLADYDTFTKLAVRLPTGEWVRKEDMVPVIPFLQESFGQKCASLEEAIEVVQAMPERRSKIVCEHLKNQGVTLL